DGRQRVLVLVQRVLDHGQVEHGGVVVVVAQAVGLDRFGEVFGRGGIVAGAGHGGARDLVGERLLVGVGIGVGRDLERGGHGRGVVTGVVGLDQVLQLLRTAAAGVGLGLFAGRLRVLRGS